MSEPTMGFCRATLIEAQPTKAEQKLNVVKKIRITKVSHEILDLTMYLGKRIFFYRE
jgi:hypothetical protein